MSEQEIQQQMEAMRALDEPMPQVGIFWYDPQDKTFFGVRKQELTPKQAEEAADKGYDLRNTPEDNSQRMLNALEPGTMMPIHRHRKTSETICMVRGKMVMRLHDDKGNVTDEFVMEPCGEHPMVQVEAGQWHSLEVLEEGTVVFEAKYGKYEPLFDINIMKR